MDMDRTEQRVSVAHVEVHLSGGAPWGFTLKGGLEHGEPLIITKIEAGGKAALCQRLRVGDELITINGTVLYGSRQEALILIKGSYRVLKLTVRRRSLPVPRPHSWHLDQISEPSLPPPPPPSPPCLLPPADSTPLPPPPPSAMQLHPAPCPLPWHNNDHSDLSIQWGALSRPYSSTDRSSSLGSMESLDTPTPTTQTNYDSHNSPVDPALFNNKRDSAYSSFSASSNMSDYATVPLRFGEGGSMENLLQNLGSNGDASQVLDNGQLIALKSRSLTRPRPKQFEMKERPSSCCYEDERKVNELAILQNGKSETKIKSNPPQPPTRKDSFRATKTRPIITNDRCSSAPIEIGNAPNFYDDCTTTKKSVQNGFLPLENDKDDCLESCYIQDKAPITCSKSSNTETTIFRPQNKHSTNVLHRHSAPEKLLAQLQLLQFDDAPIEAYMQPESTNVPSSSSSQRSQPENDKNSLQTLSSKWGGSRSSTPGSLFLEDCVEREEFQNEKLEVSCETSNQVAWGRSVSVPEEQVALSVCNNTLDNVNERDFQPLSSALSVDTLVEKKTEIIEVESATLKKSSRNLRKNRRRNERFATNLRNEIQRKKAQLQSSRGPGGLLCSGETVHEEGPDFQEDGDFEPERKVAFATTTTDTAATTTLEHPKTTMENCLLDSTKEVVQSNPSRAVQIVDSGVASFGIRVIEEPAPAGKARRWRWTPEHKLQPENDPQPRRNDEKLLAPSRHGVCAFMSSSISTYPRSMSCSRMEQSDILPFADRMKFFEETSKSGITKTASQPKQKSYNVQEQAGDLGPYQSQRRYSYQGGYRQESSNLMEARRQSVSAKEREERLRQMRGELEERETEERMRQWEREREMERRQELERIREMDRMKREKEEMEREREEYFASNCQEIHQNYHQRRDNLNNFQPDSCSAFYPVKGPSLQFDDQRHQGFTPTEMYSARQQETTKLNRKYSLTERDFSSRPWESRPVEQIRRTHRQDSHSAPAPAPLRTRAMSENDLRFEAPHQRWSPSLSIASTQTLTEVNEGFNQNLTEKTAKKKTPPPPRPPPPKWEQFHKRRASHHAIYSSSPQTVTGAFSSQSSFEETSRQRSYSLPPTRQELSSTTSTCSKCSCHQDQNFPQNSRNHHQNLPHDENLPPNSRNNHQNLAQDQPTLQSLHQNSTDNQRFHQTQDIQCYNQVPPIQVQNSVSSDQIQPSHELSNHSWPYHHIPANQIQAPRVLSGCRQIQEVSPANQIPPLSVSSNEIQPSQIQNRPTYKQPAYVPPASQIPPLHLSSNHMQEPLFTIAPPSPMFSRRSFRPVAPPQWNNRGSVSEETEEFPPPPPPVADDLDDSFSDSETNVILNQEQITKTQPSITRHTAEWERSVSPRIHSDTPPPPPPPVFQNGNPETSLSINLQQNHNLKSEFETINNINGVIEPKNIEIDSETTLSPAQSLDTDLDAPLETDIDDFQEEGLPVANEPISSELPCLALPVTVLETDLDTLPEHETSPSSTARPDSSLLEEELEVREEGSLEEIFPQSSEGESGTESWRGASQSTEHNTDSLDRRSGASSSCSSYYSTSTAKAQLLSQMKDFTEERENQDELMYKKQLMESLRKKLGVLREAQRGLQEDIRANAQLGEEVEAMVVSVCKPNEVDKFRMFIGDLDKVVSLMLSLSGRLLRVETTLDTLDSESDHEERLPLQEKKRQLMRQLSEAQDLKEHVDRREQAVSRVLGRCLSPEQHRDYSHFVKMKAALLVEQKQLEDKIRLGEEQLRGLRESLGLGVGAGFGLAMGYGQY
ncbi:protein Shroom4 [Periophthalmus magnuspinnatus]|uniref:protein Shroom4 n=1 Tax=Periophthalmus magnuspinnatus TaxID=409849 RepID=UPI0024366C85|nr:protein Shroom4 [Periophthalmus magnuspinnatus]